MELHKGMETIVTADWPESLRRETDGFTRHCYWRGFWPDAASLRRMVADMFGSFGSSTEPPILRVYVDKGQRFDLAAKLAAAPAGGVRSFERRLAGIIGHKKFCVTLNGLTRWSELFHLLMQGRFIKPLFATSGFPSGGADFYAFIGNYGHTPFGIHDDEEHSLLLHLGAREKLVYLWPDGIFQKVGSRPTANFDFSTMQHWASVYTLRPGDLLFIPKGTYHVLNSRGFSITLGFTIFPATPVEDYAQGLRLLYGESLGGAVFMAEADWETPSVRERIRLDASELSHHVWRHRMMLKSNGYITTTPREADFALKNAELRRLRFQVPPQFRVYYDVCGDELEIFARGHSLRMRASPCLKQLLEFLNRHNPFRYAQFAGILAEEMPRTTIHHLFSTFYKLRAICRAQDLTGGL
jgi:hypothetical protein